VGDGIEPGSDPFRCDVLDFANSLFVRKNFVAIHIENLFSVGIKVESALGKMNKKVSNAGFGQAITGYLLWTGIEPGFE